MSETPFDRHQIDEVVEELYREFAAPKPRVIEGCPCCIDTRNVDALLAKPLRELSGKELYRYTSGAFYTVGGERDFRYLLPRILEISIIDRGNALDPEAVLNKLTLANWRAWSGSEMQAVEAFVNVWFEKALAEDVAFADDGFVDRQTESLLCGAALAGLSLSGWIKRLQDPFATPVLADIRQRFPKELSGFWKAAPDGFRELSKLMPSASA